MLPHSHAGELLLVQKKQPAGGIIPQHGASHTLISTIFCYDFQYAPCCFLLTPLGNVLTHQVCVRLSFHGNLLCPSILA